MSFYVHFDGKLKILSVSGQMATERGIRNFRISTEMGLKFFNNEFSIDKFVILYSRKKKVYTLVNRNNDIVATQFQYDLMMVDFQEFNDNDIIIKINNTEKQIIFDSKGIDDFICYITRKNDPTYIYDIFTLSAEDFENEIAVFSFEKDYSSISIYCKKRQENVVAQFITSKGETPE
jgi:hypothetical protein